MARDATLRWGMQAIVLALASAAGAETLQFDLHDAYGREVESQDYQGRPLFLEFGACW
jgi:hypothetical protein